MVLTHTCTSSHQPRRGEGIKYTLPRRQYGPAHTAQKQHELHVPHKGPAIFGPSFQAKQPTSTVTTLLCLCDNSISRGDKRPPARSNMRIGTCQCHGTHDLLSYITPPLPKNKDFRNIERALGSNLAKGEDGPSYPCDITYYPMVSCHV